MAVWGFFPHKKAKNNLTVIKTVHARHFYVSIMCHTLNYYVFTVWNIPPASRTDNQTW